MDSNINSLTNNHGLIDWTYRTGAHLMISQKIHRQTMNKRLVSKGGATDNYWMA